MYEPQMFLRDETDERVIKIVILDTDGDDYRLTEHRDGKWCKPFWMPESELRAHDPKPVGTISSEQFLGVCQACGLTRKV